MEDYSTGEQTFAALLVINTPESLSRKIHTIMDIRVWITSDNKEVVEMYAYI
jgi:hypothetical protein